MATKSRGYNAEDIEIRKKNEQVSAQREQLRMGAALDNLPAVNDQDQVRGEDSAQPVRDYDGCASRHHPLERILN